MQFLILLFFEGSDVANIMDQSLLETCPFWVPCHQSPLWPILLGLAPFCPCLQWQLTQSHAPLFSYTLFLWEGVFHPYHDSNHITKMLMTPSPPGSIQTALLSSRPTDPIASSGLSTWTPAGTQIILFKTKIIFLHQLLLFPLYLSQ